MLHYKGFNSHFINDAIGFAFLQNKPQDAVFELHRRSGHGYNGSPVRKNEVTVKS